LNYRHKSPGRSNRSIYIGDEYCCALPEVKIWRRV